MAVIAQDIGARHAMYNGDACEVLPDLPEASVGLCLYSPPFFSLYEYSSSERDLSNCASYREFMRHYEFVVRQLHRLTKPGRVNCVHCCDIPIPGQKKGYRDFPGDIVRLHRKVGYHYAGRVCVWKEPFRVAMRTRLQHLTHKWLVRDSTMSFPAGADFILLFKRHGKNAEPVTHEAGLDRYAGAREVPPELWAYRGEKRQQKNKLSQWIWRMYASAFWDDVRVDRVLPFQQARESDEERHVCPLQLDVIDRCVVMWSNPGDVVCTPFMGVGSEVYGALTNGRRALGVELKESYFRQATANVHAALARQTEEERTLYDGLEQGPARGDTDVA